MTWRAECCAVDADTGRKCRRLAHADVVHRHERGTFTRLAAPGQTHFADRERLERFASRSTGSEIYEGFSEAQVVRARRRSAKAHRGPPPDDRNAARIAGNGPNSHEEESGHG